MSRAADAAQETLAIVMVGDGIVAGTFARRHILTWDFRWAPDWYRRLTRAAADRPWLVRGVAAAEVVLGLWWAHQLTRDYGRGAA